METSSSVCPQQTDDLLCNMLMIKPVQARHWTVSLDRCNPGLPGGPHPRRSYLDLHHAFHGLDLGLAEGSSVLGTDICPHCQVGRLVYCLQHTHTHKPVTSGHTIPACTAAVGLKSEFRLMIYADSCLTVNMLSLP